MTKDERTAADGWFSTACKERKEPVERLNRSHPEISGTNVLVVGLGATGVATARFLHDRGARVTVSEVRDAAAVLPALRTLRERGIAVETGGHRLPAFLAADLIVVSPGVALESPPLRAAAEKGAEIISEIELAYRFISIPIIAVTGTNGKTTTVKLTAEIFRRAGIEAFLGGNVGNPLIEYVLHGHRAQFIIAEISSFQLEGIRTFRPFISVLLNLQQDHLDRYASYGEYIAAKARIFANQRVNDYALLNADDADVQKLSPSIRATPLCFSASRPVPAGIYHRNGRLHYRVGDEQATFAADRLQLRGTHNLHNIMAAAAVSTLCGCSPDAVQHAIEEFKTLHHRLEFVLEHKGIRFYNDSKATNVGSVVSALESMSPPLILIAGGKDKGGEYEPLIPLLQEKVKALVLFGEAKHKMHEVLTSSTTVILADSIDDAFRRSVGEASPGDTILLSPACSSFDMFTSYEQRGDAFSALVRRFAGNHDQGNA
jgi:UDP-N-acetylmuramoylalanine--D-glutamate ligase